jgi:hypothetical protein
MKTQIGLPVQLFGITPEGRKTLAATIVDLREYPHAETDLMVYNKDGSSFLASSVRHKDFKKDGENYWDFLKDESTQFQRDEIEETPTVDFPIPTVEEVQEKIVKSLSNTNWITRYSAIRMIDYVILPTLGSEADVKFWEGISDLLKQQEKS